MAMTVVTPTEPVTAVVSRLVKPGCENAYEQWVEGITRACARFEGYMALRTAVRADIVTKLCGARKRSACH